MWDTRYPNTGSGRGRDDVSRPRLTAQGTGRAGLDLKYCAIRLQTTPSGDGPDTLSVTDAVTGRPVEPREG